jgi:AcrR family transcriptional regulator
MARQRSGETREKLLAAAGEVFVAKGFRDATVAEICQRADANIASVNYYFGSKQALYQQAWRHCFVASIKAHPQDGGVDPDAPAEARLRGQVQALIERIADENSKDFFISQREFVNPTGLLAEVIKAEIVPLREQTLTLMRELLGPQASDRQVMYCEMCLISMCIHPLLIQRLRQRSNADGAPPLIDDLEAFIDHVMAFALAGIAAVKGAAWPDGPQP